VPLNVNVSANTCETFLIVGGRSDEGDLNSVQLVDLVTGELSVAGDIGEARCLHKTFHLSKLYRDCVLIFGGDDNNSVECYSVSTHKIVHDPPFKDFLEDIKFEIEITVGNKDCKTYLLL
jgi:hypothetical protein